MKYTRVYHDDQGETHFDTGDVLLMEDTQGKGHRSGSPDGKGRSTLLIFLDSGEPVYSRPRYEDADSKGNANEPVWVIAENSSYHSVEYPSRVVLPIVPAGAL